MCLAMYFFFANLQVVKMLHADVQMMTQNEVWGPTA